jgi:hypothetical protein
MGVTYKRKFKTSKNVKISAILLLITEMQITTKIREIIYYPQTRK